jgi:hypothetical protein
VQAKGIFTYNADLAAAVDGEVHLAADSVQEVDLRAATLVGAEHVRKLVAARLGTVVTSAVLDYYLWRTAVLCDTVGELGPFHRTRTVSY